MRKIYHLSTCDTCRRIIRALGGPQGFELQDIKTDPLTPAQLDFLKEKTGSYEALFNRRARKYREQGLHERELTETDYYNLILEEYTFLKRPVVVIDGVVFAGNAKRTVAAAKAKLES